MRFRINERISMRGLGLTRVWVCEGLGCGG